jgi:hypothetical protein
MIGLGRGEDRPKRRPEPGAAGLGAPARVAVWATCALLGMSVLGQSLWRDTGSASGAQSTVTGRTAAVPTPVTPQPLPNATPPRSAPASLGLGRTTNTPHLAGPHPRPAVHALPPLARSVPVVLDIPAIGVHTRLTTLGLNPDRTVEVPRNPLVAGWYRYGPTPGEVGPAVILGHVDSRTVGPGVFFRLGTLRPRALIQVRRQDGLVARFAVQAVRTYPKTAFPTQAVYGNTRASELRLVTCGDWDTRTHTYRGNIIVFAALSP